MLLATLPFLLSAVAVNGTNCDDLARLKLAHATVERAGVVAAGASVLPSRLIQNPWAGSNVVSPAELPAFCQVLLKIHPVADSEIAVEVRLPMQGWIGRFVGVGNG